MTQEIQQTYPVTVLKKISGAYYRLSFKAPALAKALKPGQFIHIKVSDGMEPFFRRPFSVHRAKAGIVEIFFEPVGKGSRLLTMKKPGDTLDVLGPLGHPFTMPPRGARQIVFIAGGIGVAPFLLFSDMLKGHRAQKVLIYGGRDKARTFAMNAFRDNGVKVLVATDDGSVGVKGRVPEFFDRINIAPDTMIYACGPRPMLAAVQRFTMANDLKAEASCEEVMACGLGACLGCSIPTIKGYRTVCHDGPVFDLKELVF